MSVTLSRATIVPVAVRWGRSAILLALLAGGVGGLMLGAHDGAATGDVELTQLLRAMAVFKLVFVAAAAGAILWRLQAAVSMPMLGAYALACAAMAAGPGMIWHMIHLGPASLLLHGGVALSVLLLWREGVAAQLLEAVILRRRAILREGRSSIAASSEQG